MSKGKILGFGEVMLRLCPPGAQRFRQALPGTLTATFGGGEANVCASVAMMGSPSVYLTALPDHEVAGSFITQMRGLGVDTSPVALKKDSRMGIYFVEAGNNQRASQVIYDRAYSAIALAGPEDYDFEAALQGVDHLHISGITPSLSEAAFQSTLALVKLASARGVRVSCDLNYRKKLWNWHPELKKKALARDCMTRILPYVDLVIANEEDAADVLDIHAENTSITTGEIEASAYEQVARSIIGQFANVRQVAITLRESISASHNNWGAMLFDKKTDRACFAPLDAEGRYAPYEIRDIVDRVGGGDSFAAGLIHALNSDDFAAPELAIRFAVAASCLKHTIQGDFNYVTRQEVIALMEGDASGRVRR